MKLSVKIALYLVSFTRGPFIYYVITFLGVLDQSIILTKTAPNDNAKSISVQCDRGPLKDLNDSKLLVYESK